MIKILSISGSPVEESSTDLILKQLSKRISDKLSVNAETETNFIKLNELRFIGCQACGKIPENGFCIYEDDMTGLYEKIVECDIFLFGSPIYFDTVSAQAKSFIDRCNCMRPPDYDGKDPDHQFIKILKKKRPGVIVLVGGEETWFEGARRTIAGFFKWIEVTNEGLITYGSPDFTKKGTAIYNQKVIENIDIVVKHLVKKIIEK